ncbi:hypothetical protein Bbelb_058570 [Branchiostoma belcheri]|nr:hypothetical protein Bbelb_058570 [Branchiostoma belcheri]
MGNLQSQAGKRHGDSRPRNGRARSSGSIQFGMSRSEEDVREKTKEKSHSFSGLKDSLRRSFRVPSRDEQERRPKAKPKDRSQVVMGSWAGGEDSGRKKRSNSRDSSGSHRQASRTCSKFREQPKRFGSAVGWFRETYGQRREFSERFGRLQKIQRKEKG